MDKTNLKIINRINFLKSIKIDYSDPRVENMIHLLEDYRSYNKGIVDAGVKAIEQYGDQKVQLRNKNKENIDKLKASGVVGEIYTENYTFDDDESLYASVQDFTVDFVVVRLPKVYGGVEIRIPVEEIDGNFDIVSYIKKEGEFALKQCKKIEAELNREGELKVQLEALKKGPKTPENLQKIKLVKEDLKIKKNDRKRLVEKFNDAYRTLERQYNNVKYLALLSKSNIKLINDAVSGLKLEKVVIPNKIQSVQSKRLMTFSEFLVEQDAFENNELIIKDFIGYLKENNINTRFTNGEIGFPVEDYVDFGEYKDELVDLTRFVDKKEVENEKQSQSNEIKSKDEGRPQ